MNTKTECTVYIIMYSVLVCTYMYMYMCLLVFDFGLKVIYMYTRYCDVFVSLFLF